MRGKKSVLFFLLIFALIFSAALSEDLSTEKLILEVFSIASPSGYESAMASKIQELLPSNAARRIKKDNLGNLYLSFGKRESHTALLAPMDEIGYFVSGIDDEGYLRISRAVPSPHRLYDSFIQGHPMRVWTEKGPVKGVLSLPSVHITPADKRREYQESFTLDKAYLDIGTLSGAESSRKGVKILDAVTPWPDYIRLAGTQRAGPSLGVKACCALLVALAGEQEQKASKVQSILVWMAQTKFPHRSFRPRVGVGLLRAKNRIRTQNIFLVEPIAVERNPIELGQGPVLILPERLQRRWKDKVYAIAQEKKIPLQFHPELKSNSHLPFMMEEQEILSLCLPVRFSSTMVEVIDLNDAEALKDLLLALQGRL